MERQAHGFEYQREVSERLGIKESDEYTSKWDGVLNGHPVSIKTIKKGSSIDMADYFRISSIVEDFYLIVGFWEGETSNIVEEHILFIRGEEFHSLFPENFGDKLRDLLNNITNDRADDAKWTAQKDVLSAEYKVSCPNLVSLRFKRDHKKQKRIQCAINKVPFYNYFLPKYEVTI
jgi:hypothetical protein